MGCLCGVGARWRFVLCARRRQNYKNQATNTQHPQTPRCVRELRELGACAVAQPRRRERLAGARRERGVGVSDPELRQHAETPVVVKAAAIVAEAAVPTRGHTTATASEPSRMALREERA